MDIKAIGLRIKQYRKLKGLTQQELAQKSNLSVMSIRRYESGDRIVAESALESIADALDVDLLTLTGKPSIESELDEVEKIISQYESICSIVLNDAFVSDDIKSFVKKNRPFNPTETLSNLSLLSGESVGKLRAYDDIFGADYTSCVLSLNKLLALLNDYGQQEAVRRVEELTEIPKYQRSDNK